MNTNTLSRSKSIIDFDSPKIKRYNRMRKRKDQMATVGVAIGGISVIAAILLIFLYLLYEVIPMFQSAAVEPMAEYALPGDDSLTLYLAIEEQNELALRVSQSGQISFYQLDDGTLKTQFNLALPDDTHITSFAINSDESRLMVAGLSNGQALIFKHNYRITYPGDKRLITPRIDYPYGEEAFTIADSSQALTEIAIRDEEELLQIIAHNGTQLMGVNFVKEEEFMSEELVLDAQNMDLPAIVANSEDHNLALGELLIDVDQRFLFVHLGGAQMAVIDIENGDYQRINAGGEIQNLAFLLGGISLLIADDQGNIGQWFMVKDEHSQPQFTEIRQFESHYKGDSVLITSEQIGRAHV